MPSRNATLAKPLEYDKRANIVPLRICICLQAWSVYRFAMILFPVTPSLNILALNIADFHLFRLFLKPLMTRVQ